MIGSLGISGFIDRSIQIDKIENTENSFLSIKIIFEKIIDWFCCTKKNEAEILLNNLMHKDAYGEIEKIKDFFKLKSLVSDFYKDYFKVEITNKYIYLILKDNKKNDNKIFSLRLGKNYKSFELITKMNEINHDEKINFKTNALVSATKIVFISEITRSVFKGKFSFHNSFLLFSGQFCSSWYRQKINSIYSSNSKIRCALNHSLSQGFRNIWRGTPFSSGIIDGFGYYLTSLCGNYFKNKPNISLLVNIAGTLLTEVIEVLPSYYNGKRLDNERDICIIYKAFFTGLAISGFHTLSYLRNTKKFDLKFLNNFV